MASIDDFLTGGNAGKSLKYPTIGTAHSGIVVSAEARQATDIGTGEKKFWNDGNPQMQAVIGIQTDERDPSIENDDGVRYDYVKLWGEQKKAFLAAARAAGGSPEPGDFYSAAYVGDGEKKNAGFNAPKLYKYEIKKANPLDAAVGIGAAAPAQLPTQVAPAVAAAPAAPVAQAAPAGGLTDQQKSQIGMLLGQGLTGGQIARVIDGVTEQDVEALRIVQAAVGSGPGF